MGMTSGSRPSARTGEGDARGAGPEAGPHAREWLGPRGKQRKRFGPGVREKGLGRAVDNGPEREEGAGPQGKGKGVCGLGWCGFWIAMGLGLSFVLGWVLSPISILFLKQAKKV